jgi:predicted ATP-dependent serine protease
VGLGGEVRPVGSVDRRLAEAQRQGFIRGFVSARATVASGFKSVPIGHVGDLARELAA